MFAIIEFKNNQCKVKEGSLLALPNFEYQEKDKKIIFDKILLIQTEGEAKIGTPHVQGATVSADIVESFKTDKVRVFKFRAKKRYKRTSGSRQKMIRVKINKINLK